MYIARNAFWRPCNPPPRLPNLIAIDAPTLTNTPLTSKITKYPTNPTALSLLSPAHLLAHSQVQHPHRSAPIRCS